MRLDGDIYGDQLRARRGRRLALPSLYGRRGCFSETLSHPKAVIVEHMRDSARVGDWKTTNNAHTDTHVVLLLSFGLSSCRALASPPFVL